MNSYIKGSDLRIVCLFLVISLMIAAWPATAQLVDTDGQCPPLPEPTVRVTTFFEAPAYNFEQPLPRLKDIVAAQASAVFHRDQPVGFAIGELNFSIMLQTNMIVGTDGRVCARPAEARIDVGFQHNSIYVARELARNTCGHAEVLAHEEGHLAIDRKLLAEYQPILQQFTEAAIRKLGIVRATDPEEARRRMQNFINDQLELAAGEMNKDRGYRQQAHDNPAEYQRLSAACGGTIQQIVNKYGQAVPAVVASPGIYRVPATSARTPATAPFQRY